MLPLDLAAKIDETAKFEAGNYWGRLDFPPPFGRPLLPAEQFIAELDGKTGASCQADHSQPCRPRVDDGGRRRRLRRVRRHAGATWAQARSWPTTASTAARRTRI